MTRRFTDRDDAERYVRETRNWGRWGPDDQRGALNLVTPARRRAAAALVRTGAAVSLARPFVPAELTVRRFERAPAAGGVVDELALRCHGPAATHLDALCHTWDGDGMWSGHAPDVEIGATGVRWGGLEHFRDGVLTRGVLLDIPRLRGEPHVRQDGPVHGDELAAAAREQGVRVEPGDALLIHSGREEYEREVGAWSADPATRPGLESSCLTYIRETDCAIVLWDMGDVRPNEFGLPFPVHAALFAYGVPLVDAALLEPLAVACAAAGRWEFLLSVNPLHIVGATGCLVNPIAVF
ncbi:MAG TPA: cyclase family protein [Mycobacteriales bacterium]|nr:cyclase family protein [Mycobacteriales bacterium]